MRVLSVLLSVVVAVGVVSGCSLINRLTGPDPREYFDDPRQVQVIEAAERFDVDRIRALAASGVDLNGVGNTHDPRRSRLPLLFFVVEYSGANAVTAMLRAGADPLRRDSGNYSPAGYAILRDKISSLRAILDYDAKLVESPDRLGGNILHTATLYSNRDAITLLLQRHVDLNTRESVSGETPLFVAATERQIDICMTLLKAGADASIRNRRGRTFSYPLYMANEKILSADFKRDRSRLEEELRRRGFPVETGR